MISTISVANYRSIIELVMPMGALNLITGLNGSGKSNLYRALRLLAETAQGGVVNALAHEGGLESAFWAGPEKITSKMLSGEVEVQGGPRKNVVRLRLGFSSEEFGYSIDLGLPEPSSSAFSLATATSACRSLTTPRSTSSKSSPANSSTRRLRLPCLDFLACTSSSSRS